MEDLMHDWGVRCEPCDLTIGELVDGRFEHDTACSLPLRIEGGSLACCRCGGSLKPILRPIEEQLPAALGGSASRHETPVYLSTARRVHR